MDLRNLCSKLDMDAIRAKIPPLPQIKLPKSMSKLKSRKIFRSSRENIDTVSRRPSSKRIPNSNENLSLPLEPPGFINRTPNRISTISSLMNQRGDDGGVSSRWKLKSGDDESFYRSAGGIDDYYPSPLNERFEKRISRPISPVKAPPITQEFRAQSEQNIKMSFGDRLQRGYKDVTEFKLKHLFAKKTVVRTDQIEITEYIHRFDQDRLRDERVQEKIDQDIANNYKFHFKMSKQKSEDSYICSPSSTPEGKGIKHQKCHKTVSELSGDESGMESSPPLRKPGIAATRFSRVRHTPLSMSLEENNDDDDGIRTVQEKTTSTIPGRAGSNSEASIGPYKLSKVRQSSVDSSVEEANDNDENENENGENTDDIELNVLDVGTPKIKPNTSALYDIKKHQTPEKAQQSPRKYKSIRERMTRFTKQKSDGDECKRSPQETEENEPDSTEAQPKSDTSFETIRHNFKRLQKSMKLPHPMSMPSVAESEKDEANSENKTMRTRTQQFSERIKRFRSTEHVNRNPDENEDENKESPIHKFANKLHEWKKSIKKKVDLHNNTDDADDYKASSPQKPIGSLMNKLKHIRSRKRDSTEDPDDDEEGGDTYKESLAARAKLQLEKGVVAASLVPQKTIQKISETKKYFKKKQENTDKDKTDKSEEEEEEEEIKTETKPEVKRILRPPPPIPRPYYNNSSEEEDSEEKRTFIKRSIAESQLISMPAATAVWTTKSILSDDTLDYDDELPRVLLHQDNSDVFESTLIIAVTRPISRTTTPIITELPPDSTDQSTPDTKPDNWIPNQATETTSPLQRQLSKESNTTSNSRAQSRKHSIDSSSEDSWFKDIPKGPSIAVLDSVYENEKPWKIQKANPQDKLYKTKSIDLFEMQKRHGGVLTAFEDFDDELKNTPVVKIDNEEPAMQDAHADNDDRESSEELENADDDNSSRVTKISVHNKEPEPEYNDDTNIELELKSQPYSNSRESLYNKDSIDSEEENDKEASDKNVDENSAEHNNEEIESDCPPSKTPSPPPSISPTPPPLPQRQPSIRLTKISQLSLDLACPSEPPPPLPLTKPPIPPNRPTPAATPPLQPQPPKIPDRYPATRISKPLVKTASLRLAYSEQVNPEDIGKVNKLISRFEPEGPRQKPRIIPRKHWTSKDSEEYSDEEDSFEITLPKQKEKAKDATPTNHQKIHKSFSIDSVDLPNTNNNDKVSTPSRQIQGSLSLSLSRKATSQIILDNSESTALIPSISISSNCLDANSNFSQPSSVYGSPLPYPSSLNGSTEVTPLTNRKESECIATRRHRRSMARDDEHFYSFDSDEENSYYSLSSTSSNRYVIDL